MAAMENRFLAFLHGRARPAGAQDWPTPKFMSNITPYTRGLIRDQLGRWSWPDLARALSALEEAHLALISRYSVDPLPHMLLENLVLKLASLGHPGR